MIPSSNDEYIGAKIGEEKRYRPLSCCATFNIGLKTITAFPLPRYQSYKKSQYRLD